MTQCFRHMSENTAVHSYTFFEYTSCFLKKKKEIRVSLNYRIPGAKNKQATLQRGWSCHALDSFLGFHLKTEKKFNILFMAIDRFSLLMVPSSGIFNNNILVNSTVHTIGKFWRLNRSLTLCCLY